MLGNAASSTYADARWSFFIFQIVIPTLFLRIEKAFKTALIFVFKYGTFHPFYAKINKVRISFSLVTDFLKGVIMKTRT